MGRRHRAGQPGMDGMVGHPTNLRRTIADVPRRPRRAGGAQQTGRNGRGGLPLIPGDEHQRGKLTGTGGTARPPAPLPAKTQVTGEGPGHCPGSRRDLPVGPEPTE